MHARSLIKPLVLAGAVVAGMAGATHPASARGWGSGWDGDGWHHGGWHGGWGPRVIVRSYPGYYAPPVYYAPRPPVVYYAPPPPVYYAPPPVYYYAPPVVSFGINVR